jgi:hypothetical protein
MVILRATSILGGQKVDKRMMCNITQKGEKESKKGYRRMFPTIKGKEELLTI